MLKGQPSTSSSASLGATTASSALRRSLRSSPHESEEEPDELSDPRPWETRAPLRNYGSSREVHSGSVSHHLDGGRTAELPMHLDENEARRRFPVEKTNGVEEKQPVEADDQGKWAKGHGPGPGVGGRRGLPPKQRVDGWVGQHPCLWTYSLIGQRGFLFEHEEWIWAAIYTSLSMITRFWRIGEANYVVWDEASFSPVWMWSSLSRPTLASSAHITSTEISTLTSTHLWAKCLSVLPGFCQDMAEASISSQASSIPRTFPTLPCESCSQASEPLWCQ